MGDNLVARPGEHLAAWNMGEAARGCHARLCPVATVRACAVFCLNLAARTTRRPRASRHGAARDAADCARSGPLGFTRTSFLRRWERRNAKPDPARRRQMARVSLRGSSTNLYVVDLILELIPGRGGSHPSCERKTRTDCTVSLLKLARRPAKQVDDTSQPCSGAVGAVLTSDAAVPIAAPGQSLQSAL